MRLHPVLIESVDGTPRRDGFTPAGRFSKIMFRSRPTDSQGLTLGAALIEITATRIYQIAFGGQAAMRSMRTH
jgi:hypothetical protein